MTIPVYLGESLKVGDYVTEWPCGHEYRITAIREVSSWRGFWPWAKRLVSVIVVYGTSIAEEAQEHIITDSNDKTLRHWRNYHDLPPALSELSPQECGPVIIRETMVVSRGKLNEQ